MNKGIVTKRVQYSRDQKTGRRFKRCRTIEDLNGLVDYLDDDAHANHAEIKMSGTKFWRCHKSDFGAQVEAQANSYRIAAAGQRGRPWAGDIVEHLVIAPDNGADLSAAEEQMIVEGILAKIAPRSPAAYGWHSNPETLRWELHLAVSSFTNDHPARLRVTDLRRRHGADYRVLLDEAGATVIEAVNLIRRLEGRPEIRTLGAIRDAKKEAVIALISGLTTGRDPVDLTVEQILGLLSGSAWTVKKATATSVSLVSKDFSTPFHVRWLELLHAINFRVAELARGKAKGLDKEKPISDYRYRDEEKPKGSDLEM